MRRILYLDAGAGVSGDMFVGALLDLGADPEVIRNHLAGLGLEHMVVNARPVKRRGLMGTKFEVLDPESGEPVDQRHGPIENPDGGHSHRGLAEIRSRIEAASLPASVARDAVTVFERLAAAEAKVHGIAPNQVHFHELGALDTIADVVAAASAYRQLEVDEAWCSPLHVGSGRVRCAHGVLPVPAPATVELLVGAPVYSDGTVGELVTPTGAALVRHFCSTFGPLPKMVVEKAGYGAGSRDFGMPNLLRAILGAPTN